MSEYHLTMDELTGVLPDLDELAPFRRLLLTRSVPDGAREWSGSGELETIGSRLIPDDPMRSSAGELASEEAEHLGRLYTKLADAVGALASGRREEGARALLDIAELEATRDRPDRAEAYAGAAYAIARRSSNATLTALAQRRWARAARSRGQLADAFLRYEASYRTADAVSDGLGAAEAAIGAGNVVEEQGRWSDAEQWYRRALASLDSEPLTTPQRWHALLNLHIVFRSRGELERSVPLLQEAAAIAADINEEASRPFVENAWGQLRMAEGAFDEAEGHLREALMATGDARARITVRINLAECLLAQGRTLDASEQVREAELDAVATGSIPRLPEVYRLLGRILSEQGNADAFVLFERGLEIVREYDLPHLEAALLLKAYGDHERRRGNEEDATNLVDRAREALQTLGISHDRSRWSDVFGPKSSNDSQDPSDDE